MRRFAMMLNVTSLLFAFSSATGQQLAPASSSVAPSATPSVEASPPAIDEEIVPTFETQKLARTYILDIPAPHGQNTNRNGAPLAQNQLIYNLAINFPTPLEFNDAETLDFAHRQIAAATKLIGRPIHPADDAILRHYHNRGILPFEIATNLSAQEYDAAKAHLPPEMTLRGIYLRLYPQGKVAGQIVGYCGRTGRNPDGIIDNHETIWPETEGREGIEQTFNAMLTGRHGEYKMTFDKDGRKTSEKIISPPVPGYTVVTTLDLRLQELAEKALEAKAKRGAIVIMDPNNGDVLALASWPDYNPNVFVPSISAEKFKASQDDPGIPIRGEVEGRVPNDSYMKATHGRKLLNGDIANLSIGQGDTQVTPLQMAQAMSIVANGGTFYQTRLVQQVQSIDGGIVTAYNVREKKTLNFSSETMAQLRTGMVDAVNAPAGTAHAASLETVSVAGKTGTAQWGPKNKERTAAWFAGYVPAEKPQYAFAALYEGDVGVKAHGGTVAAPMIAQVLKELYKGDQANGRRPRRPQAEESPTVRRAEPVEEDTGD